MEKSTPTMSEHVPLLAAEPVEGDLDFRLHLQQEFLRRTKHNPRYSLRAFARMLQIEPSALSKILSGKRPVTPSMFDRLCSRLGMGPGEKRKFKRQQRGKRAGASRDEEEFLQVTLDTFEVISDWFHYAILELMTVQGFSAEPRWIARALDLTVTEVQIALERMKRLGLIVDTAEGGLARGTKDLTTLGMEYTSAALRKVQRQVLEKAITALEETPFEKRDQSTITVAVNPAVLPEAKRMIKEFRRTLGDFLEASPPNQEVYHLTISLYPVSETGK